MESKTGHGPAFFTLQLKNDDLERPIRLAYLQNLGGGRMEFYELWNTPAWDTISGIGSYWEALHKGAADGSIYINKLRKSPSTGMVTAQQYDLSTAVLEDLSGGSESVAGGQLPKTIRITVDGIGVGEPIPPKTVEQASASEA